MQNATAALTPEEGLRGCIASSLILGERRDFGHPSLISAIVRDWESPSFSPVVIADGALPDETLVAAVERHFRSNPIANAFIDPRPYVLVPQSDFGRRPDTYHASFEAVGWSVQPDPLSYNRLVPSKALEIPPGLHVRVYDVGAMALPDDYGALLGRSFGLTSAQLASFDALLKSREGRSFTLTVHDDKGVIVAGGTVSALGRHATMTWGAVDENHRGRDIHRTLIGGCVSLAASTGVEECWLATRNPRVRNKWDGNYDLFIARPGRSVAE